MNKIKILAILLIVSGILGSIYTSFSYTKQTDEVKLGPIEMSIEQKKTVEIPIWVSVGAIVVGSLLLISNKRG